MKGERAAIHCEEAAGKGTQATLCIHTLISTSQLNGFFRFIVYYKMININQKLGSFSLASTYTSSMWKDRRILLKTRAMYSMQPSAARRAMSMVKTRVAQF
eukprot:scaffold130042_cov16-Tisochrysis_lutea.AAC.2